MSAAPPAPPAWKDPPDYNSLVHFIRKHVQPPSARYVTRDDVLELLCWAPITNTTVNLSIRMMGPDGEIIPRFEQRAIVASGAGPTSIILENAEGFLISASIETPGAPRGQAFVALRIRRGGGSADITQGEYVMQGYPGQTGGLSFPGSLVESPKDGRGQMRSIVVPNPAAGADWTQTVPAGTEWIIRSVTGILTNAVAVANRVATLEARDGAGVVLFQADINQTLVAGNVYNLSWFPGALVAAAANVDNGGMPQECRLPAGFVIRTVTAGLQAADQWSAIALLVEQFVGG